MAKQLEVGIPKEASRDCTSFLTYHQETNSSIWGCTKLK
jgi:hypothetical protein